MPSSVHRVGAERRRGLKEHLLGPDRVLARRERHLVIAGQRQGACRAGLHAEAAHDAAQVVDLVVLRVPLPRADRRCRIVVLALDPDRVGRARVGAQLAPDALLQAVVVPVEAVAADVRALRRGHDLLRVLLGVVAPEGLLEDRPHALDDGPHGRRLALGVALVAHVAVSSCASSGRGASSNGFMNDPISHAADDQADREERALAPPVRVGQHDDRAGREHPEQPERDQVLPAEIHQPVVAQTRERGAHEHPHVQHSKQLHEEPHQPAHDEPRALPRPRTAPPAEEQGHNDRGRDDGVHVLPEREHRERDPRVLRVVAGDELGLRLGEIERRAVHLGERADHEHDERRELGIAYQTLSCASTISDMRRCPANMMSATSDEPHRDLVAHHLRARAHPAEQRVVRAARPAGEHDRVDADRGHREHPQDPDRDVGELQARPSARTGTPTARTARPRTRGTRG